MEGAMDRTPAVGDAAILDGLRFTIAAIGPVTTELQSEARDADFGAHPPGYEPHPTGPLRISEVRTHELVWFEPASAWTLAGRLVSGRSIRAGG